MGDVKLDNQETYYDTFCRDRDLPDKAVKMHWIKIMPEGETVNVKTHRSFCTDNIAEDDFKRLTDAFNIPRSVSKT